MTQTCWLTGVSQVVSSQHCKGGNGRGLPPSAANPKHFLCWEPHLCTRKLLSFIGHSPTLSRLLLLRVGAGSPGSSVCVGSFPTTANSVQFFHHSGLGEGALPQCRILLWPPLAYRLLLELVNVHHHTHFTTLGPHSLINGSKARAADLWIHSSRENI